MSADLALVATLLQRLDVLDRDLRVGREELAATPRRIADEQQLIDTLVADLNLNRTDTDRVAADQAQAQAELDRLEARLARAKSRVPTLVTAEQIAATDREITSLESQCSDAETEVLEAMEAREGLQDRQQDLVGRRDAGTSAQSNRKAEWEARSRVLQDQDTALSAAREEVVVAIPVWALTIYQAALDRGPVAGASASGITTVNARFICGTCHGRVPPAWAQEALNNRALKTCDGCKRVIVYPSRTAPEAVAPTAPSADEPEVVGSQAGTQV